MQNYMFCTKCGDKIEVDIRYCQNCGQKFQKKEGREKEESESRKIKRKNTYSWKWKNVAIGLLSYYTLVFILTLSRQGIDDGSHQTGLMVLTGIFMYVCFKNCNSDMKRGKKQLLGVGLIILSIMGVSIVSSIFGVATDTFIASLGSFIGLLFGMLNSNTFYNKQISDNNSK